ncbi:MAG TPA: tetratricopeptide repeat protein [Terriglobales bacterium]|nr:tetratricopeptide repeat protein [Terriglobales bacterium]
MGLALAESSVSVVVAGAQSAPSSIAATLRISVRDSQGHPLSHTTLKLESQGGTQKLVGHTDTHGQYRFALRPGSYTVRADLAGYASASFGPFAIHAGSLKTVNLTLSPAAASQDNSGSLQFFDEPQFTIAGVTDPTSLGAHGSNATAPAKADLTREVVSLSGPPASAKLQANEQTLRAAAERQPADFDANRRLGKLLLDSGQPREALPYLQRASQLKPADYQSSYDLALAYASAGEYEPARATLKSLLANYDHAELHHLLGDIEEKQGHSLDAAREYERAAKLEPSEADLFDWGAELLLHGAAEPAIQVFSEGNRRFPESVRTLLGLGVACFAQGDREQAARYLGQASDLNPANPRPYLLLGKIAGAESSPSPGIAERLERFAQLHPEDAQANYYYAVALWKESQSNSDAGKLAQASALLRKATQLDSSFAAAYLQLGILQAEQKKYPEAIASYQKAIAADPLLPDAHYRLAQVCVRSGDQPKARAEMRLYNQLARENAQQSRRERSNMQQFVYTLRSQTPASQPR